MSNAETVRPNASASVSGGGDVALGNRRTVLLAALTALAVGAALARRADGSSVLPTILLVFLQLPATVTWLAWRCGLHRVSTAERTRFANGVLALVVLVGGAVAAISTVSLDTFTTAMTVLVSGCLGVEYVCGVYRRVERDIRESRLRLRTLLVPWLVMILLVTVLLAAPVATHSGVPDYRYNFWLHVSEAGFTAVSTACLVGNSIHSFGEDYSLFGQAVIVLTTHLAGMCFAAIGLAIFRPFMHNPIRLRTVLFVSYGLQIAAVVVMWSAWHSSDVPSAWGRLWWGVVHSGSAIWNAGVMARPEGLMAYLSSRSVFVSITTLSIVGSLGLPLILDLVFGFKVPVKMSAKAPVKVKSKARPLKAVSGIAPWRRLSQWEAGGAFVLLLFGAVMLFFLETPWRPEVPWSLPTGWIPERPVDLGEDRVCIRDDLAFGQRWTLSVFVSATLRSAGMQSLPLSEGAVSWPSYALILVGMLIGGSAGGVGGGMRTSSLLLLSFCLLRRRAGWNLMPGGGDGRRYLIRMILLFVPLWIGLNAGAILLLGAVTDATSYELVLDGAAACNGVGLSTGLLPHLTWAGRLVMILTMLAGRIVPVVFWIRVARGFDVSLQPRAAVHA